MVVQSGHWSWSFYPLTQHSFPGFKRRKMNTRFCSEKKFLLFLKLKHSWMFALELLNIIFYNCVYISWYLRESEDGIDLCHINPSAMHLFIMRIMS